MALVPCRQTHQRSLLTVQMMLRYHHVTPMFSSYRKGHLPTLGLPLVRILRRLAAVATIATATMIPGLHTVSTAMMLRPQPLPAPAPLPLTFNTLTC